MDKWIKLFGRWMECEIVIGIGFDIEIVYMKYIYLPRVHVL